MWDAYTIALPVMFQFGFIDDQCYGKRAFGKCCIKKAWCQKAKLTTIDEQIEEYL